MACTFFHADNGFLCSSVSLQVWPAELDQVSAALQHEGLTGRTKGSAILPSANHQGVPLLGPWHNWQTVRCHLTPLFQCSLFPPPFPNEKGGERGSLSPTLVGFAVTVHWTVSLEKLLHTELYISGSGSANVGDRGIWGLKPLYLSLHKSSFMAYTSALANMICIVTSLPAG